MHTEEDELPLPVLEEVGEQLRQRGLELENAIEVNID